MRLTILLVGNFLSSSGGNPSVGETLAGSLEAAGYRALKTSSWRPRFLRLLDMLFTARQRRAEYQLAYVEVFSGPAFFWAEAVVSSLRLLHKPFILALHGGNLPVFASRHPGRLRRLLRGADAVVAPSTYLIEKMSSYGSDIHLIPNPVELSHYPFRQRAHPQPHLIWLRAFHQIYNPSLAIRVVAGLCEFFPGVSLTMIGPDKGDGSFQAAQRLAAELGITERITLVPGVPKRAVPGWLEKGDIFINTTDIDNTPVSVLEAMACGLCVVSTAVGGIPYLLENEKDALLVPTSDPDAMVAAIGRVLTEQGLAGRLSANARTKAEQFDWSVILPKWEALFQGIFNA